MVKSPYLSEKSSDFDETRYTKSDIESDDSQVTKNWNFLKFKMVAAAILKIVFLAITHQLISAKFCMSKQNGMLVRATGQKNAIF